LTPRSPRCTLQAILDILPAEIPLHLLIIEDDPAFARFLQAALKTEGHAVDVAASGNEGLARAAWHGYEILLLDLLLRDMQGLDLLHRLRQGGVSAPIIAVGGSSSAAYVVRALDAGADEYVTKPVTAEEVTARVRALMRRSAPVPPVVLVFENVTLNIITHQGFVNGRQIRLTPKEFSLLHQFMRRQGEPISRTELLERVWDMHFDPGSNVVEVHISRLRGKLHQASANVVLEAVRGAGFVLSSKVETSAGGERHVVA
jgi:DNA-binding response OmpR family regulator